MKATGPNEVGPEKSPNLCRYCGEEIRPNALKCPECKSILRFSIAAFTDSQLLLAIATPLSLLVAAITYLASVVTPYSSNVKIEPAGRAGAIRYYVVTNSGNADARLIRAVTKISFSDEMRAAAGLKVPAEEGEFLAAAPMSVGSEGHTFPPGVRPIAAQLQDHEPTKQGTRTANFHFTYMIDMLERETKNYIKSGNKAVADALIELISYSVGNDDRKDSPAVEQRLNRDFKFNVEFFYAEYNGKITKYSNEVAAISYVYWIGNYSDAQDRTSRACKRLSSFIKSLKSLTFTVNDERLYRGICL